MSVKIALAGNPNCGKTTLFNALTGSNQFVGNWPGVTVEKKEGKLKGHKDVVLTDLPGIYSLSPYTLEEVVARNYILQEKPDAIINIVDGTNIERNLYLTTQILELGIPVIMAVNMMDIVEKNGDTIHIDKLKKKLGCEVVTISALKGTGITEAANKAVSIAQSHRKVTPVHEFCDKAEEIIGADLFAPGRERAQKEYGINVTADNKEVASKAETIILSVKPQFYASVIADIKDVVTDNQIIITIAPGKTLAWLAEQFGKEVKIVRTLCPKHTIQTFLQAAVIIFQSKVQHRSLPGRIIPERCSCADMIGKLCHQKAFSQFRRTCKDISARIKQTVNQRLLAPILRIKQLIHGNSFEIGWV